MKKILIVILASILFLPQFAMSEKLHPQKVKVIKKFKHDKTRVVKLFGPVRKLLTDDVVFQLQELDATKRAPITLLIDSNGGSVRDGADVINAIDNLDSDLTCVITGNAFSMAAVIATSCPKLYIHKFGMVMFHEASFTVSGNIGEIERLVEIHKKFIANFEVYIARKLGIPLARLVKLEKENWWLNASEAVSCGFASAVVAQQVY